MSPINVNDQMQGYSNTVKSGIVEEGVRLPFPVAVLRWMNGDSRNKKQNDATYYGGWAVSADSMDELMAQNGVGLHAAFAKASLVNNDGKEYGAYISRSIIIAVCARRKQWTDKGSHVQWVGLAAELNQEKTAFKFWAPVMLTAKGYSAKYIEDVFSQWDSATATCRREFASNLPSQFFWAAIGTFGTEIVIESVGKKEKSPITPCKLWLPKEFNEAAITRHFVGEDNMRKMADFTVLSEEWRKAWAGKDKGQGGTEAPENFPAEQSQPATQDDTIPF